MDCMWLRHLAQGKMHYWYSWIDFRLCKVCMTPCDCMTILSVDIKVNLCHWSEGSCLDDAIFIYSHFDMRINSDQALIYFVEDLSLRCICGSWGCLIEVYIHLLDHSHAHKTLCLFSNQTKSGTGTCGVQLRSPPFAQYKKVSRRFPKCLYFLFYYSQYLPFPLEPRAAARSLTPTSCYSEICLS